MTSFLSTHTNKIDRKGRVSVPAPFRAALEGQEFKGIVVYRSFKFTALEGSGMDRITEMSAKHEAMDQFSAEYDMLSALFGDMHPLPFDSEGRIVLPEDLIEFTGITETAAFFGTGSTFQIWEPGALQAHKTAMREQARATGLTLPARRVGAAA